jgi:hypothetical protein
LVITAKLDDEVGMIREVVRAAETKLCGLASAESKLFKPEEA